MSSISAEMPKCPTAGSREGAGVWRGDPGPGFHSGPQGAAREAGRRAGGPNSSYLSPSRLALANSGAYTAVQRDRAELLASTASGLLSMARASLEPRRLQPPPLLLCNWQPQPGGETVLPRVTRPSLRLLLPLFQSRASGAGASARGIREQLHGFPAPSPSGGRGGESQPRRSGPERPRDNGEEAAAPGGARSRESRWSLVGGRRGWLR